MNEIQKVLEDITELLHSADVNKVFGEPRELGEQTLIPVAEVSYGFGAGYGSAKDKQAQPTEHSDDTEEEDVDTAKGGGGGGGARVRPLAYIEVGPKGTRVTPIEDEQKTALAGILLVAWIFGWIGLVIKEIFD
ncbi:MAG: GerW family sporulation protein [Anaerolineae bacterium]